MQIRETIGIDVSKKVIDICIHTLQLLNQFENNSLGFKKMLDWIFKNSSFKKEELFFMLEHTGMYSDSLAVFLDKKVLNYNIVPGLEIKRSIGITRGKDDKVDAKRIALYAYRLRDELIVSKVLKGDLKTMKILFPLRKKLVKQRAGFIAILKEQKNIYSQKQFKILFEVEAKMILELTKQINKLEKEIRRLISNNKNLTHNFILLTSIKGIGEQTAITMLIYTENFTKFETWRKFASYCGVAPFPCVSGSSVRGRTKVSQLANKDIKSLLSMCAITSIQYNPEMKQFYQKRVEEGKNKMSTINIIRNKLISRMFAVIKRQTPYVDTMKFAA